VYAASTSTQPSDAPTVAVLVTWKAQAAEEQRQFLFGEHHGYLPFGRSMNQYPPALLHYRGKRASSRLSKRCLSAVCAERGPRGFDLPHDPDLGHDTHGYRSVVCEQITIQRIESRIVDVR
jgi:hypothetical protein